MDDNSCLNKEFIIKDEHSSQDEHSSEDENYDANDPLGMLQVKNHQLDNYQENSNQVDDNSDTNKTQQTIQDYDSDEDLAGIQMKLRIEQQKATLNNSQQTMQDFNSDEETPKIYKMKRGRPTVKKPPTVTNQPTLSKECAICQQHFVCRQDFIDHARKYHPNGKAFRCSVCSMVFVNIHSVSRHSKNHKDRVKKHVCEYCLKSFLHRDTYKRHIEIHNKGKIYSCSVCGNSYKHKYSLRSHQKTHLEMDDNNGKKDLNLACKNKQISFEENEEEDICLTNIPNIKQEEHNATPFDLQPVLEINSAMDVTKTEYVEEEHLMEVQKEGEIYKIEYVDEQQEFDNNSNTNDTQDLQMPDTNIANAGQTITDSKRYKRMSTVDSKCAVCHQEFTIRQDLIDHVQQYHPNAKAFKCSICSMRFSNILSIARHRRVHKNLPKTVCPYCSKSFIHKDDYKRHITNVHSIQIANNVSQPAVDRKCAICHEEFNLRQDLIKHASEFHPKQKAFKCTICSMVFKNIHYISRHRRNHKTLPRKYHCELCFKSYRDLDNFKRHLKVHNIGTTYHCSLCNIYFQYKVSLRNHELMHSAIESLEDDLEKASIEYDSRKKSIEDKKDENSEGIQKTQNLVLKGQRAVETKCAVCKQDFKYRQDLMKHAHLEHPNERAFKCSICPRVFKNIHYLSTHRRVHKNLPRKHVCKICSKSFRDQDNFTRHLKVHTRTRLYPCSLCNKSYKHQISLENHKKTHLEKPLIETEEKVKKMRKPISASFQRPVEMKCAVCQQEFDYRFELVNHVQLNHPYAKAYKCGLCPMVFANIVAVSHHRNIHKIFDCKLCSKSFTCKDDLKLHIRIHTKERPYCCFVCKTTYKRRDSWLKHKTCHCKSNKTNDHNKHLKAQNESFEINKSLEYYPDMDRKTNSNADGQNELEVNSEHIEDEHILQIDNDKQIHKNDYIEDDQLKDNFNTNKEDDDDFLLEKMANQKKTSAEYEKYALVEDNSEKDDHDYINDDKEDDDCANDDEDDEEDDYNADNDDDFVFNKKTNRTKRRTNFLPAETEKCAVLEDISYTNDSQQIILTDEEDDEEDKDYDDNNDDEDEDDDDYNEDNNQDDDGDIFQEKTNSEKPFPKPMLAGQEGDITTNDAQNLESKKLFNDKIKRDSNMAAVDTKCAVCHQQFDSRKMLTKHAEKYHPNDDAFKCNVCLLLFKSIHAIASHVRSHGRQIIDKKCGVCHKEFAARHELVKHAKEVHPNERAIKCALCPRVFKSTTCMSSHRRSHKNMPKKYVCNACNTSFSDIGNYKAHLKSFKHKFFSENREKIIPEEVCASVESQDTNFQRKLTCPFCSLTFTHKDDFKYHLKTHTGTSKYRPQLVVDRKCAACQKEFKCRQDLLDHANEFHPNEKAFKCALCPMVFQHIISITGHRRRVHKCGQRKHFCKVCKKYVSQDSVRSHLKTNRHKFFLDDFQKTISKKFSEEGVKDNLCTTTISNENNKETFVENCVETQSKHELNQDLNKIIISNELDKDTASLSDCVIKKEIDINCESKDTLEGNNVFEIYKTELINDAASREDNNISIRHDASQNTESFDDGYILESLTNMEETLQDFTNTRDCKICGESFISKSHLRRHFSKHSQERPYKCSFCYRRYKRKDDMRTHQRKFHLDLLISLAEKTIETDKNKLSKVMNNKDVFRSQTRRYLTKNLKERPFKCSFCYRRYKRKIDLETHQTNFHFDLLIPLPKKPIDKEENVKDINEKEAAKSHLRSYLSIHSKERPFKCSFCYRRYSRKDFMKAHQKKFHSDRLNSLANKTIDNKKYLKLLNDNDFDEKVNDEIITPTANQDKETNSFKNAKEVKEVIEELSPKSTQSQDTPKENVCKICYISCISKAHLIRHLTAHSNERPYNCSYCIKTFKRKDDKKAHEKRMHNKYYIADQNKKARKFVAANFEDNSNKSAQFEDNSNTFAQFKDNPPTFGESNTASIKSANSLSYQDNILFNEDFIHSQNLSKNTDEIQCHKNTPNIEEEEPFSVNVLEITKSEYVCNEPISFHIQEIEDPINPCNELPNDSLNPLENLPNKTTDFNEYKEEKLVLYQDDEKLLPNEYHFDKAVINDNEHLTETLTNRPSTSKDMVKKHVCEICSKSFYSKMNLKRHYIIHTRNKYRKRAVKGLLAIDRKCAVCEKEFICRQDFIKHAEYHHPNDKAFKCNLCPMLFLNVSSIPRHRKKFHKELAMEKFCPYCSETFNRRDYFQKHLQEHRKSLYNSTQDVLSFNEESNEETMSQDNNSTDESLKSSIEYEQTNKHSIENELQSEYNSEEEDEEKDEEDEEKDEEDDDEEEDEEEEKNMELKNSFEIKEEHYTDNDSQDDSDIEECETSTNYSQQNTTLKDKSANYSHQHTSLGNESIGKTSTPINIRGKKPPMLDNKCAICFQIFDFQRDLVHHAQQYHPSAKALKCRDCDAYFSHHGSVSRHFRIHKKLTKKYVCEFCSKSFPYKDYLKTHLRVHTTFKGAHSCNICGKSYKHMDSLVTHQKIHLHEEANECNKVLNIPNKVKGEESTKTTSNAESDQIKQTKPLEKNSPANEARTEYRIFRNISDTLTRFKSRHKLLEGKCAFCKMVINSYQDFVMHLEKFHPEFEAFKCKKCDNRFSNTKSLSSHMYYTHNENRKKHICKICSKSFDRSSNLKSHVNIHTEERPFPCNVCEKFYKDNRDLKRHQKIHLKRKPKDLDKIQQLMQMNDIKKETMNLENNQHIKNELIVNEFLDDHS